MPIRDWLEQGPHARAGPVVAHADDDAVGVREDLDGLAEPQVLRRTREGDRPPGGDLAPRPARASDRADRKLGRAEHDRIDRPGKETRPRPGAQRTPRPRRRPRPPACQRSPTTTSASRTASDEIRRELQRARAEPACDQLGQPRLGDGWPAVCQRRNRSSGAGSNAVTECPAEARHAAVTEPRCQSPRTATFMHASRASPDSSAGSRASAARPRESRAWASSRARGYARCRER